MQNNLTIKRILALGFGTLFVLILIANIIGEWNKNSLINSLNKVALTYKIKEKLEELEKIILEAEAGQRAFLYTGKNNFLDPYTQANTNINDKISSLRSEIQDPKQLERLNELEKNFKERIADLEKTIALKRAGKEQEVKNLVSAGAGMQIMERLRAKINEMKQAENQLLVERSDAANAAKNFSTYFAWISNLIVIAVGLGISLTIIRTLAKSLGQALKVAKQVSLGNLTTKVEVTSSDEIGQLQAAFQTMIQSLNTLIKQVQKSGIQITTSATQIAASGKQLETIVNEQVASTNEVVATAKEIGTTSLQLEKTIDQVSSTAKSTAIAALGGQKSLNQMETTMRNLADATTSISGKLSIISEKANNINTIITTITKVAAQTNLLSLNAAIEAEKAGEYGVGFAVVAREIRRLADQTAVSTLDIENMVKEMQAAVSTGVMEMDKFTQEVSRSVDDVQSVSWQLMEIIDQVQSLIPRFQAVHEGMEMQVEGAQQISEVMAQLSDTTAQTAETLGEINGAIAQLNEAAQGLHQEISRFKVG